VPLHFSSTDFSLWISTNVPRPLAQAKIKWNPTD
jgi:hypothetical protein